MPLEGEDEHCALQLGELEDIVYRNKSIDISAIVSKASL